MVANITVSDSQILCIAAVPTWDECTEHGAEEDRSLTTSLSLESEVEERDDPTETRDIPLDNCTEGLESGQDAANPGLESNATQSMPRGLRGSLVASFSSDSSSEVTGASISRTPSLSSTRSEPRQDPSDVDTVDTVGVVSDVLDPVPGASRGQFGGRSEAIGGSRKKNGFHRVRSNSAPDLLKVLPRNSPMDVFRGEERGATSLSPPPPADSKFWSPLTLRPPPLDRDKKGPPESRGTSMWLGTEGGQILVYSPGSSLRSRSNRCTIQLPAAIHCIRYIHLTSQLRCPDQRGSPLYIT